MVVFSFLVFLLLFIIIGLISALHAKGSRKDYYLADARLDRR